MRGPALIRRRTLSSARIAALGRHRWMFQTAVALNERSLDPGSVRGVTIQSARCFTLQYILMSGSFARRIILLQAISLFIKSSGSISASVSTVQRPLLLICHSPRWTEILAWSLGASFPPHTLIIILSRFQFYAMEMHREANSAKLWISAPLW